ncbi:MAG: lipoyl synthase [Bacteroidales bacterium]|jgi:lipoic acid synthetase|nr:lipoyl synthase [Bacteroidales bacterium]MBQ2386001.1 lipoyl synthase [Bacteroidales bacterium]MEE0899624.1 lipoyl synthase [Bacteroidales bacterium]MEE0910633.1 lipoyl synthase [Bacteroidales bacterium]MEE0937542.1 lipoyl synthase [Bacteroidales bacterium]
MSNIERKPDWLKIKLETGENYPKVKKIVELNKLHTICSSGKCPNIGQCWSIGTATFMISGDVCTRSCKFCATKTGKPLPLDPEEPAKIAESVRLMQLKHCVITSVDRDDLADKSAEHWAKTIEAVRKANPNTTIEVLTPDFDADERLLNIVFASKPDVFGHNMETVKRLSDQTRSRAKYDVSLKVLSLSNQAGLITKTGIMVGLGESEAEVVELMQDVRKAGVRLMTIGQYLQPTKSHIPVIEYVTPEQFAKYREIGLELGFDNVESGPLVRSSYMAEKTFIESKIKINR